MRDKVLKGRQSKGSENGQSKLSESDVSLIKMLSSMGVKRRRLVALFGVSKSCLNQIKRRITWKHVPEMETPADLRTEAAR